MVTPAASVLKFADQVTGFNPLGSPLKASKATPSRNAFPPRLVGTVVVHVFDPAS